MLRSVGLYLTRFDEAPEPAFELSDPGSVDQEVVCAAEAEPPALISDELRESLLEEGRAASKAEFEALLEQERAEFEARLRQERNRWAIEEGERLGGQFRHAFEDFVLGFEARIESILEPFVVENVRKKMLSSLIAQLRALLSDHDRTVVQLSGPMDLLEVICAELNMADVETAITEVGGADVKVRLESTLLETSIKEWLQQLRGEG